MCRYKSTKKLTQCMYKWKIARHAIERYIRSVIFTISRGLQQRITIISMKVLIQLYRSKDEKRVIIRESLCVAHLRMSAIYFATKESIPRKSQLPQLQNGIAEDQNPSFRIMEILLQRGNKSKIITGNDNVINMAKKKKHCSS